MNVQKFLVSGIAGGIVNFLVGGLLYGIIFESQFPVNGEINMIIIALGSLVSGLFTAYIFTKWAHISNWKTGLQAGAVIGLFLALYYDIYSNSSTIGSNINWSIMGLDIVITIVCSALSGAVTAIIINKIE
jgi:FtsH-binding integral membrane protein